MNFISTQPSGGEASLPLATTGDPESVLENASADEILGTDSDGCLEVTGASHYGVLQLLAPDSGGEATMGFRSSDVDKGAAGDWVIGANGDAGTGNFGFYEGGSGVLLTLLSGGGAVLAESDQPSAVSGGMYNDGTHLYYSDGSEWWQLDQQSGGSEPPFEIGAGSILSTSGGNGSIGFDGSGFPTFSGEMGQSYFTGTFIDSNLNTHGVLNGLITN